eukprot:587027-Prymnesium_polylepis.1
MGVRRPQSICRANVAPGTDALRTVQRRRSHPSRQMLWSMSQGRLFSSGAVAVYRVKRPY